MENQEQKAQRCALRAPYYNTDPIRIGKKRLRSHTWGFFLALDSRDVLPGESSFYLVFRMDFDIFTFTPLLCSIELGLRGLLATAAGAKARDRG